MLSKSYCKMSEYKSYDSHTGIQGYLGDIVGLVPDYHNKVNITIKQIEWIFWFPIIYESHVYTII